VRRISAFLGPSSTGFAIDGFGFPPTTCCSPVSALIPVLILTFYTKLVPPRPAHSKAEQSGSFELLKNRGCVARSS
jgi:hypothetical protein